MYSRDTLRNRCFDRDFFQCDILDAAPKDDMSSMEHPIFSLSTKPDTIVELSSKKVKENNPNTLRLLETQIKSTDRQIDNLVYDLSPEEIELVEQSTS